MNAELQALKKSPRLPEYVENLRAFLEAERQRRQQFYEQISENDKAEFIGGETVFHSPVKKKHLDVSTLLFRLLSIHVTLNRLGEVYVEKAMIELTRNSYEPDICFFERKRAAKFSEDQMLFPAPDFVVEIISKSTEKNDRGVKFDDYAAHGIKEYWIVDPGHQTVEQYWLTGRHYELNFKGKDADVESKVVKGFRIPVRAIFDEKINLETLQRVFGK